MYSILALATVLVITLPTPPAWANGLGEQTDPAVICHVDNATYKIFLPGVFGMPKSELLRRMDEAQQSSLLFDRDVHDPTETSTPNTPEGVSVKAVVDGILIEVDFTVDTAHLHPRFQSFIVYVKPIGSEATDGSGIEVGRFSDNDWTWQPPRGGYTGWFISLTAISNTGRESGKSPWQQAIISTYYDDFSDYGGATVSSLESLNWLKIAAFESNEAWTTSNGGSVDTTIIKEGGQAIRITTAGGVRKYSNLTVSLDLSEEGRFTDDDYVCIAIYVSSPVTDLNLAGIIFRMNAGTDTAYAQWNGSDFDAGWNLLAAKRSDLNTSGTPDWSNITSLEVWAESTGLGGNPIVVFDDWRIVKADPNDATTFNDTGPAWGFKRGAWHVYTGNRTGEPGYDFSLGQIQGGNLTNFIATRNNVQLPHGRVSAGVMIKGDNGRAGLLFRVTNTPAPLRVIVADDISADDTATAGIP